jgi:uncharacterized protein
MKIADTDIVVVPGLGNSGPDHWQSRWIDKMPTARRVEQDNWDRPDKDIWVARLHETILMATRPVVLVGHSLGVHAIVQTARLLVDTKVRGAFLVSAPDLDMAAKTYPEIASFAPASSDPLPFPSFLIGSASDPLCTPDRAEAFALDWGAEFHNAGEAGHINAESGHGPWPEGMMMFARFMQRLG